MRICHSLRGQHPFDQGNGFQAKHTDARMCYLIQGHSGRTLASRTFPFPAMANHCKVQGGSSQRSLLCEFFLHYLLSPVANRWVRVVRCLPAVCQASCGVPQQRILKASRRSPGGGGTSATVCLPYISTQRLLILQPGNSGATGVYIGTNWDEKSYAHKNGWNALPVWAVDKNIRDQPAYILLSFQTNDPMCVTELGISKDVCIALGLTYCSATALFLRTDIGTDLKRL